MGSIRQSLPLQVLEKYNFPSNLAIDKDTGNLLSKETLIKNIKELYAAKGTSEATKLFMRIFLGEEPSILYPNDR